MKHWRKKTFASPIQIFQMLTRLERMQSGSDDHLPGALAPYFTAIDVSTGDLIMYFPPGTNVYAAECGASICKAPDVETLKVIDLHIPDRVYAVGSTLPLPAKPIGSFIGAPAD